MNLTITLDPEQFEQLAEAVADKIGPKPIQPPLTPKQFVEAIGGTLSLSSIWRLIKAGELRAVPNVGKTLIPAEELKRFV